MFKRIAIRNFRSLRDVSVDLDPITVLVGASGTGKTNLIDAMRFLRRYLLLKEAVVQGFGGWGRLVCATAPRPDSKRQTEVSFEVTFNLPGVAGDFCYTLVFSTQHGDVNAVGVAEESLTVGGQPLFHQKAGTWLVEPKLISVPHAGAVALDRINGIQEVNLAYLMLIEGYGCYDFGGDVLCGKVRQQQAHEIGLADDANNYRAVLETITRDLRNVTTRRDILASLRRLSPSLSTLELEMPSRTNVLVGHQVGNRALTLNLDQQSEGFRRFLAHLLALYQVPHKQTLFFEEPEKGIYPGAFAVLADHMKASPDAGGAQVILTTHSPELLDHFDPEQLRIVTLENLETRVGPLASEQVESVKENLLSTGELLTTDPARISIVEEGVGVQ